MGGPLSPPCPQRFWGLLYPPLTCPPSPGHGAGAAGQGERSGHGCAGPGGSSAAGEGSWGALLKQGGHYWIWGPTAGFGVSFLPPHQSVLGKVNEIAKHKATVQDADTQSKVRPVGPRGHGGDPKKPPQAALSPPTAAPQIHQLYETLQSWDAVASALPDVVQRLVTLRDLHEQGEAGGGSGGGEGGSAHPSTQLCPPHSHPVRAGAGAPGHDAAGDRGGSQGQRRALG